SGGGRRVRCGRVQQFGPARRSNGCVGEDFADKTVDGCSFAKFALNRCGCGRRETSAISEAKRMPGAEDSKLAELQKERQQLARQVDAQADELSLLRARFSHYEMALRGSHVRVYTQDQDLRYTSASDPMRGHALEDILGHTDDEVLPADSGAGLVALKREVLATGQPKRGEFAFTEGSGTRWYDVHIEPMRDEAGDIAGLTCA